MRKINVMISVIIMCVLVMVLPEKNVEAKGGSISIELEDGGEKTSKEGVEFSYAKVAGIKEGEIVNAVYPAHIVIDESNSAEEVHRAALEIEKSIQSWDGAVRTDSLGKAVIQGVSEGLYLIAMTDQEAYDEVQPILITIPFWNEEQGNMEYDITVIPKHEPTTLENPKAPQTNLESHYKKKIIGASLCALGGVLFLAFLSRKGKDEEHD